MAVQRADAALERRSVGLKTSASEAARSTRPASGAGVRPAKAAGRKAVPKVSPEPSSRWPARRVTIPCTDAPHGSKQTYGASAAAYGPRP